MNSQLTLALITSALLFLEACKSNMVDTVIDKSKGSKQTSTQKSGVDPARASNIAQTESFSRLDTKALALTSWIRCEMDPNQVFHTKKIISFDGASGVTLKVTGPYSDSCQSLASESEILERYVERKDFSVAGTYRVSANGRVVEVDYDYSGTPYFTSYRLLSEAAIQEAESCDPALGFCLSENGSTEEKRAIGFATEDDIKAVEGNTATLPIYNKL